MTLIIDKGKQIADAVAMLQAAGEEHLVPLFSAVCAKRLGLLILPRGEDGDWKLLKGSTRPTIVLIGDDDYASTGPSGWPHIGKLRRWANTAIVHAAAGAASHYQLAVDQAQQFRRLLLIETDAVHAEQWVKVLAGTIGAIPTTVILPSGAHPVRSEASELH
jgi:hypothetical protein